MRLKLMPEHSVCFLWAMEGPDVGCPIEDDFPLSSELREDLENWCERYSRNEIATLRDSPARWTAEELEAFDAAGIALLDRLRRELGPDHKVLYFSQTLGSLVDVPDE